MRGNKLKITQSEFKKYLIDKLVDEEGNKVSVRKLIENPEFMDYTGLYQEDLAGNRKPCSIGTMTGYINNKFKLSELALYEYHTEKTKRIKNIPFLEWSNCRNRGKVKKDNNFSNDRLHSSFIKFFKPSGALPQNYALRDISTLKEIVKFVYDKHFGKGEGQIEIDKFYYLYDNGLLEE